MGEDRLSDKLVGRVWARDRLKDEAGGALVYRSADAVTPLGRGGRESISFSADGRFEMSGPAADDRSAVTSGTWAVDEVSRTLKLQTDDGRIKARATLNVDGDLAILPE